MVVERHHPDCNPDVAGPHSADGFQDPNGGRSRVGHRAVPHDYKEWVDGIPELTAAEKQLHEQRLRDQLLTPPTEEELDQLDPDPKDKHPSAE